MNKRMDNADWKKKLRPTCNEMEWPSEKDSRSQLDEWSIAPEQVGETFNRNEWVLKWSEVKQSWVNNGVSFCMGQLSISQPFLIACFSSRSSWIWRITAQTLFVLRTSCKRFIWWAIAYVLSASLTHSCTCGSFVQRRLTRAALCWVWWMLHFESSELTVWYGC